MLTIKIELWDKNEILLRQKIKYANISKLCPSEPFTDIPIS